MFCEWTEVELDDPPTSSFAVFPSSTANSVCARLMGDLSRLHKSAHNIPPSKLNSQDAVQLSLQITCYGVSLPFGTEYETLKECVALYRHWLTCTNTNASPSIPSPILNDPLIYSAIMLTHIYNIFVPRYYNSGIRICGCNEEQALRQTKECHQALTFVHHAILECDSKWSSQLWPSILKFALKACDLVLAEPFEPDDISTDHLGPRLLDALFQLWTLACFSNHFPSPNLWKTLRVKVNRWRHRSAVIDCWVRNVLSLSKVVLTRLFPSRNYPLNNAMAKSCENCSTELIEQTWFRLLHLFDHPQPTLSRPQNVTGMSDIADHPCFSLLPYVFYRHSAGINVIVSLFLGQNVDSNFSAPVIESSNENSNNYVNVPPQTNPQSSAPSTILRQAFTKDTKLPKLGAKHGNSNFNSQSFEAGATFPQANHLTYLCLKGEPKIWAGNWFKCDDKPSVVWMMQLYGDWLFSIIGVNESENGGDTTSLKSNSSDTESKHSLPNSISASLITDCVNSIAAGRAEAVAGLCRLMTLSKDHHKLPHKFFVKFYAALAKVLNERDPLLVSYTVMHCRDLWRMNLHGVHVLVPSFLNAIVYVLHDVHPSTIHPSLDLHDLRAACLNILSSVVCLPAHFGAHAITDLNCNTASHTFIGLRQKILKIILIILTNTKDFDNIQQTLAIGVLFCEEMRKWEEHCSEREKGYYTQAVESLVQVVGKQLSVWVRDHQACIAALHTLCCLAHNYKSFTWLQVCNVVVQLCTFVEHQLSRPHPHHSRDMHSTVVCALWAVQIYILNCPQILNTHNVLHRVTDVIELGICGAVTKNGPPGGKKPASQRVHDVAQQLLYVLFCRAGWVETCCNEKMVRYLSVNKWCICGVSKTMVDERGSPWLYLTVRSAYIGCATFKLAIPPESNQQHNIVPRPESKEHTPKHPLNTKTVFSERLAKLSKCRADTLPELHVNDKTKSVMQMIKKGVKTKQKLMEVKQPDSGLLPPRSSRDVDVSRLFLHDLALLDLNSLPDKCRILDSSQIDFMKDMTEMVDSHPAKTFHAVQVFYAAKGATSKPDIIKFGSCLEKTSKQFRRFLMSLGKVSDVRKNALLRKLDMVPQMNHATSNGVVNTVYLDGLEKAVVWSTHLHEVAFVVPSPRNKDSVAVITKLEPVSLPVIPPFVEKTVQKPLIVTRPPPIVPEDIVAQQRPRGFSLDPTMLQKQFKHMNFNATPKRPGIKGFLSKHLPLRRSSNDPITLITDARERSKSQSRLALEAIESEDETTSETSTLRSARSHEHLVMSDEADMKPVRPPRSKSSSMDSMDSTSVRKVNNQSQLVLIWTESLDDRFSINLDELTPGDGKMTGVFVHPLESGLVLVSVRGIWGRLGCCGPLTDGCVLSLQALTNLLHMTVLCFARHKALEHEILVLPNIKRRQNMEKFTNKYVLKLSGAEILAELLQNRSQHRS